MPSATQYRCFVAVSPGLEPWLAEELSQLGIQARALAGGAEFRGPRQQLWQVLHYCRLAESVRVRLKPFHARSFSELEAGLARLPWHAFLPRSCAVRVSVTCHRSRLYHSDAIVERVLRVLGKTRGCRGADGESQNAAVVSLRLSRDEVQASVDAGGERLHRRGYRKHVGRAPLRETLAAALARLLDSQPSTAPIERIWDPFCGSGTLPIEWLANRDGRPIERPAGFAFESWPSHDAAEYQSWRGVPPSSSPASSTAIGSDRDPKAISAALANSTAADLAARCDWRQGSLSAVAASIPRGCAILTNPPYGSRLATGAQAARLLSSLDRLLAERTDLRPAIVLTPHRLDSLGKLRWQRAALCSNGGIRATAWALAASGDASATR